MANSLCRSAQRGRRSTGLAVAILVLGSVLSASCTPPAPVLPSPVTVAYTSIDGTNLTLSTYEGNHVALMIPIAGNWDAATVWAIVGRLDAAYAYYTQISGHEPAAFHTYDGRDEIAVVPTTCGAGCSYIGFQGMEILTEYWQLLYDGVAQHNQYDQVLFYEFGRNFWFLTSKLTYVAPDESAPVTTGFADLNRFTSMDAAGVTGAPFGAVSFSTFRSDVHSLVDAYEANTTLNWANTLKIDHGIPGSYLGAADLFTSFVMRLADYFGPTIYTSIWLRAAERPDVTTTAQAVDNFVLAASAASGHNLTTLFSTIWRFPVSSQAKATAQASWGNPWVRA